MASKQMLAVAVGIAMVFLPLLAASATVHPVGDSSGWTLGFDYTAWSESKQFTVGDALGNHASIIHYHGDLDCLLIHGDAQTRLDCLLIHGDARVCLQCSSTTRPSITWWR